MELWEQRLFKIKNNDVNKHKRELKIFLIEESCCDKNEIMEKCI